MPRTTRSAVVIVVTVAVALLAIAAIAFLVLKPAPDREHAGQPKIVTTNAPTREEPSVVTTAPSEPTMSPPMTTTPPPAPPVAIAPPPSPNEDGVALLPQVKPGAAPAEAVATDAATFVAFAPGTRLLVARASGRIEFVHLATGQREPVDLKLPAPRAVALSPAGDLVAVANADAAEIWHVANSSKTRFAGGDVTAIVFARGGGGQLATGHAGGEVKIWDTASRTNVATLRPGVGAVAQIAQSPPAAHLAVIGASGGGVAVCDVGDHQVKQRLGDEAAWTTVAFSPDGRTLAAAGAGGVSMWDTMLWQKRAAPGGNEPATHVAFWRGGTVIVTANSDGAIRIYDMATRQLLTTLSGGGKPPIVSLDLADDGRTIAAANPSGIVIWDSTAQTSRLLQ